MSTSINKSYRKASRCTRFYLCHYVTSDSRMYCSKWNGTNCFEKEFKTDIKYESLVLVNITVCDEKKTQINICQNPIISHWN